MRIAIYTEYFYPHIGGQEVKYYTLAKELASKGHIVDIYTTYDMSRHMELIDGINIYRIIPYRDSFNGERKLSNIFIYALLTSISNFWTKKYDFLVVNQMPMSHLFLDYHRKFNVSYCLLDFIEYWRKPFMGVYYIKLIKNYDGFIALNKWVLRFLIGIMKNVGVKKNLILLPPPIDTSKLTSNFNEKDPFSLLYVGRLVPHKNVELLLYTLRLLTKIDRRFILNIVGRGPMEAKLRSIALMLGINRNVRFWGYLDEDTLVKLYKKSGIYLIPSKREGYSISTLEAMACKMPVITCNYENNYTQVIVNESGSGMVTRPDPYELAKSVLKLVTNKDLLYRLGNNACTFAKKHDVKRIAKKFEYWLKDMLEGSDRVNIL